MNRKLLDVLPHGASDRIAAALANAKGADVATEFAMGLCGELVTMIEHLDLRLREVEARTNNDA